MVGALGCQRNAAIGSESHLSNREALFQRPAHRRTSHAKTIEARNSGGGGRGGGKIRNPRQRRMHVHAAIYFDF